MWSIVGWNKSNCQVSAGIFASGICNETSVDRLLTIEYAPKFQIIIKIERTTYRALKKNISQVNIGSTGRKNCRVTGMSNASMSKDAAPVFNSGPGAWLIESENIKTNSSII